MPARTPHNIVDAFDKQYKLMADRIARLVEKGIAAGLTPEAAVNAAFQKLNLAAMVDAIVMDAIKDAYVIGMGAALPADLARNTGQIAARLEKVYGLKQSVWQSVQKAQVEVASLVQNKVKQGQAWQKVAVDVGEAQLSKGQLAGKVNDLVRASRRIEAGADVVAYRKKLKQTQRYVEGLAKGGAPTGRLKDAYQQVIEATQKQSEKAVRKSVQVATDMKMRYEAERVVRTETARAYGTARYNAMLEDDDVVAVRSVLSSRHNVQDICDYYAGADNFGLGAGVYPKDYAPPYPYHPNCLCTLQNVYKGELKQAQDFNPKGGEAWLKRQPRSMKQALLGKRGMEAFNDNPASWQQNIKGFGFENKTITQV